MATPDIFEGSVYRIGDSGYEEARRQAVWNDRIPDRFPDFIVQARNEHDVVAAIRLAKRDGMKVGIRSGGHSWNASFLRDAGMLIDLSRMTDIVVTGKDNLVTFQPGVKGDGLNQALRPHGLFFPTGHCSGVGLGGFLLQGGFGWNSRLWGPACASIQAIDVVTADGELIRADESQNADIFWAARGAGPGFFGVVTRFYARAYLRPRTFMRSSYVYPIEALDDVLRWAVDIRAATAKTAECVLFIEENPAGYDGMGILVTGRGLAYSDEDAIKGLSILDSCPVLERAAIRNKNVPIDFDDFMSGALARYPDGLRYAIDNMWTSASAEALLPGTRAAVAEMPSPTSNIFWMLWGPVQHELPDMLFSMQSDLYISLNAVWKDKADDAKHLAWVADHMRALEPLSDGIQLADENLGVRPFRYFPEPQHKRFKEIRRKYDPDGMFHSFMGQQP